MSTRSSVIFPTGRYSTFCGSGAVVTANPAGGYWNDLDIGLYRLAQRYQSDPRQLEDELRAAHKRMCAGMKGYAAKRRTPREQWSDVDFIMALQITFGSRLGGRGRWDETKRRASIARIRQIPHAHRVWRDIHIANLTWDEALAHHAAQARPVTVFADPPYPHTRTDGYAHGIIDFTALDAALDAYPGPVFRTGNREDCDWPVIEIDGGHRKRSNIGYSPGRKANIMNLFARDGFRQMALSI